MQWQRAVAASDEDLLDKGAGLLSALLVGVGAAIGGPLRYLVSRTWPARPGAFPWATFGVNVVGSWLMGVALALSREGVLGPAVATGLGAGFCGALTTYSTLALESMRLTQSGSRATAAGYVSASVLAGVAAAALGWGAGSLAG